LFREGPLHIALVRKTGGRPFRQLEISFSEGGEWKALISGGGCSAAEQRLSG
jgi:hypothetical protein